MQGLIIIIINSIRIFTDDIAEKLLGEDYNQIAKSMSDGIDCLLPDMILMR